MQYSNQENSDLIVACPHTGSQSSHEDSEKLNSKAPKSCGGVRYLICLLLWFSFLNATTTRTCISVAIVVMVNSTQSSSGNETSEECPKPDSSFNGTLPEVGEFEWTADTQSAVLSAFFYGYVISQLPGGYIAERFGGKFIIGWTLLSSSILSAVSPILARLDVRALITCRFFMGFFQGPLVPSMFAVWGLWAPPLERTRLINLSTSGGIAGDLVGFALTGLLCSLKVLDGWPLPFYVFSCSNFLCFVLWMLLYNDPEHQKCISESERHYIVTQIYGNKKKMKHSRVPWRSMLTSIPMYGLLLNSTLAGLAYYVIFTCGPTYMKQVLNFDISQNGILTAAPYMSYFFCLIAAGPIVDFILVRRWLSVTATRKTFTLAGGLISAGFIVAMGYVDCDRTLAIAFLLVSWGIGGFASTGPIVSTLDISPQHAGTVMGLMNMFNNVGGFLSPVFVLLLTKGKASQFQWRKVFFMTGGFTGGAAISYVVLGSSVEQNWSDGEDLSIQLPADDERQPLLSTTS